MDVQQELLKTAAGITAAVTNIAGSGEDALKAAKKEAGSLAIRGQKEKESKQEASKVEEVKRAEVRSQDALAAAQLQRKRRESANYLNLINSLRKMKADELKKREETK